MKLGAAIPVLNEWRFIPAVVGQLLSLADRCVLVRGYRSFSGAEVRPTEVPALDPRVELIEGNWTTQADTRNAGMEALADCDYVFMVDSDEILVDGVLAELRELCRSGDHQVIALHLYTYWKTSRFRIDPPEPGTRKVVLRRDVRMVGRGDVQGPFHVAEGRLRHLSYVRTDDEVKEKIRLSGHADEIIPTWYEEVWKQWDQDPSMRNLHPVHPMAYARAVFEPDPELDAALARWGCL